MIAIILIFIIIIVAGPIINKFLVNEHFQNLDLKYYHNDEDCIFNRSCQLPPNNINFYNHKIPLPNVVNKLKCNFGSDQLDNCTNDLTNGNFKNKSCPCQVLNEYKIRNKPYQNCMEGFVSNSPGLYVKPNYPICSQGFYRTKDNKCRQFCRGCKTGICSEGMCSTYA